MGPVGKLCPAWHTSCLRTTSSNNTTQQDATVHRRDKTNPQARWPASCNPRQLPSPPDVVLHPVTLSHNIHAPRRYLPQKSRCRLPATSNTVKCLHCNVVVHYWCRDLAPVGYRSKSRLRNAAISQQRASNLNDVQPGYYDTCLLEEGTAVRPIVVVC